MEQSMDHDALCAAQSRSLIAEGFMDEEFTCYGTVFMKENKPRYYVCSTETSMNRVFTECILNNIYPAPPQYFVMRASVPAGMREEIRQKFKYDTARKLKVNYPPCYFQAMDALANLPPDNQAMPLLKRVSVQLENQFDSTGLEIFKGLLQHALLAKHVTKENYQYWMLWLTDEYHKMEDDWLETNYYHRMYSGYGTILADKIVYRQNAFETVVAEQRNKDIIAGKLVTPIIRKHYYTASFETLRETKDAFGALLQQYYNEAFAEIVRELAQLKSVIPEKQFQYWLHEVQCTQSKPAIDSLNYYGHIWNVKSF
ncbi:MAG: hypothetical protein J6A10_02615 [Peptococcaceae bacterium]|nr:hypothetical protein [Peptococcaceae bacterium]